MANLMYKGLLEILPNNSMVNEPEYPQILIFQTTCVQMNKKTRIYKRKFVIIP